MDDRNDAAYGPSTQTGYLSLAAHPTLRLRRTDREISRNWQAGKRFIDLFGSASALILLSPIMLGVGATLALTGGSVVFRQQRVGLDGRIFSCLKFRSMVPDAEQVLSEMLENDPVAR
jgi:Sugar transferases involved in lipopolysaccharide synthesis